MQKATNFPAADNTIGSPMILMTCHGTVLCRSPNGTLIHVDLRTLGDGLDPIVVDLHGFARLGRHERMLTKTYVSVTLPDIVDLPTGCTMVIPEHRRTAFIKRGDHYFCAEPQQSELTSDRTQGGLWESFLFVTEQDFACIRQIFQNSWVIASTRTKISPEQVGFQEGFLVSVGDVGIDLRYNLPLLAHASQTADPSEIMAFNVLIDGWKIERIYRYRPLIYFTAFGSPYVLEQLYLAIGSLIEFGRYDGDFHIITDQERQLFLDSIPNLQPDRLSIQHIASRDWVGYVAAKYSILDFAPAHSYQPLLFLDTDIVCDALIEPLLTTVVTLERMSAPLEEITSLRTNPSVGATLIQKAGLDARAGSGVNGGTIGIPNLQSCAELLELTRTIITNHTEIFGRDQFRWVDQEVLNFMSFCVGQMDSSTLLRYVRYGWQDTEFTSNRRLGIVHFWPGIDHRPKQDRMRDYVATLRQADKSVD